MILKRLTFELHITFQYANFGMISPMIHISEKSLTSDESQMENLQHTFSTYQVSHLQGLRVSAPLVASGT